MKITCAICNKTKFLDSIKLLSVENTVVYCECVFSSYKIVLNNKREIVNYLIRFEYSWILSDRFMNKTFIGNDTHRTIGVNTFTYSTFLELNDVEDLQRQAFKIICKLERLSKFD